MSTEDNSSAPEPITRSSGGTDALSVARLERQIENLKAQVKGISGERNTWKAKAQAAAEAAGNVSTLTARAETAEATVQKLRSEFSAKLALADAGISSTRARRAILREYDEEHRDVAPDARPSIGDFLGTLREDPFFAQMLPGTGSEATAQPTTTTTPATGPTVDVNEGTSTSTTTTTPAPTLENYQRARAKAGGRLQGDALKAQMEKLRAAGVIQ